MAEITKIEWADATVNFWAGCTKVSPACDNCYAEKMAGRLWDVKWGAGMGRRHFLGAADTMVKLDRKAKREGGKPLVFINSMSDLFDNEVDDADRQDAFEAMSMCTELVFLLLTKRIGNVARYLQGDAVAANLVACGRAYLGITVVNQEEADRDIPKLLAVPARVRFLSMEPLLGPVDLTHLRPTIFAATANALTGKWKWDDGPKKQESPPLDWVIVGGESDPRARPMHPDWARSLRDQCAAAGVPFLFKQCGEWTPGENVEASSGTVPTAKWFNQKWDIGSENLACEPYHCDYEPDLYRIGKKAAGRLLDGIEHNGFPAASGN